MSRSLAILKREFKAKIAYRMAIGTSAISLVAGLLAYGLLGNTAVVSVTTSTYKMSLAAFLVSGVAFAPLITNGLGMFSNYTFPTQIEEVMVTPTDFRQYLLLSSMLSILTGIGGAALSFVAGIFLFGLTFAYNVPALAVVILLGVVTSVALGFLGVAFQLVYKQTAIVSWLLYAFTGIAGNMLVPTQVLPGLVQDVSFLTPQYYFFTGIRASLGSDVAPMVSLLTLFGVYSITLVGAGLLALDRALRFLRRTGTHRWT
jgi:ABC-type multidrug transport system permease subunit